MGIDWIGWTENLNMVLGGWNRISKRGERETDLNRAGAAVDGRGQPVDCAIAVNQHIDIEGNIELTVVTVEGNRKTWLLWLQPWIACINVARLFFFVVCHSLVYEVDVGTPDLVGRNPHNLDVVVFIWVPRQPVIWPSLNGDEGETLEKKKKRQIQINSRHDGAERQWNPDVPALYIMFLVCPIIWSAPMQTLR